MTPLHDSNIASKRSPFLIIYATVFIDLMGFGIVLPLLPFHVERFGAAGLGVGATLTAYSAMQFIAAPLLGRLSDRYGRRPLILMSLGGSAAALALSGVANSLALLIASRALAGAFGGSIGPAQAYIADVTTPANRAKHMGLLGASIGLGFILGPALGAALSPFGFATVAFVAAGLALLNFVFALVRLPESRWARPDGDPAPRRGLLQTMGDPSSARIFGAMFLTMFAFVGMETTFALLGKVQFGLTDTTFGILIAFVGLVAAVTQVTLVHRLSQRLGVRRMALVGAVLMASGIGGLPLAHSLMQAGAILGVMAVGQGLLTPALMTLNSLHAGQSSQGGALGLGQSFSAAARATGPVTAGWLFDVRIQSPYIVGAVLIGLAMGLLLTLRESPKDTVKAVADGP